jgi:hypothetical protein
LADARAATASTTDSINSAAAQPAALAPVATDTATALPASVAQPAASPAPAAQVAPALLSLAQSADGGQQMTLRLHPAELGMVQVRIDRAASGGAAVEITVEKADTMQALLRDQAQLHRTLDEAGVSATGRTITFTMAPEPAPAAGGGASGFAPGSSHNPSAGSSADSPAGNTAQSGSDPSGGGRSGQQSQSHGAYSDRSRGNGAADSPGQAGETRWLRVGLDITA